MPRLGWDANGYAKGERGSLATFWGFPKMVGFPNNHAMFLLKMISTWGVKWGYHHLRKHYMGGQLGDYN